jgi:pyruvate kinase
MSFVNHPDDIKSIRKIIGYKSYLISKIETLDALKNIKKISKASNALLIDRGDLSREVPIEKIPVAQEYVLNNFKKGKIPVFVATNLLETMIKTSLPTRAESHDIYSTLKSGASGLVLAAESAIGTNPVECVKFLKKCVNVFNEKNEIKFN